jgi:sulfatase modifying factor 1
MNVTPSLYRAWARTGADRSVLPALGLFLGLTVGLLWRPEALRLDVKAAAPSGCAAYAGIPAAVDGMPAGMVLVRGGHFTTGSDRHYREERPERIAEVGTFWIDRHEVTNAQFAAFVAATGYITVAERPADPRRYPGARPELLLPGAVVFSPPAAATEMSDVRNWWRYVPGANWRQPEGPESSIAERMNHPVVHVVHEDAQAYARWAGRQLPTEVEWEFAARGGLAGRVFVWGDAHKPDDAWAANVWQGRFPAENLREDGFAATAPVGCFPANGFGLFDMAGNVWEITDDDYRDARGSARDHKVVKGGSYLCAESYCFRYRPSARQPAAIDSGASNIGFRTVLRVP